MPSLENKEKNPETYTIKPTYHMQKYDRIWYYNEFKTHTDETEFVPLLDENEDYILLNKPANMVIHATGIHGSNTLLDALDKQGFAHYHPVHRLDRETSGLLICAKSFSLKQYISQCFREGMIKKMYLAVTKSSRSERSILPSQFRVQMPIGTPFQSLIRLKLWVYGRDPLPAETWFWRISQKDDFSLYLCFPQTGRTNQIRIHLAALGEWIVGDKMYHPNENVFCDFFENGLTEDVLQNTLFPRHLLHNAGIQIVENSSLESFPLRPKLNSKLFLPNLCPLADDFYEFEPAKELLESARLSRNSKEEQIALLKEFFEKQDDLSNVPVIER